MLGQSVVIVHLAIKFIICLGTSVTKVMLSAKKLLIARLDAIFSTKIILGLTWFTLLLMICR